VRYYKKRFAEAKHKLFLNFFPISKQLRVNRLIRVPTVRLIDENDEQMGIKSTEEALHMAEERGFDLVEVAPKANPPVCKILDYGKYLYRLNKQEQKQKKSQKQGEIKGIRITFRIDQHDLETKINRAREFIGDRNSVKVTLIFRGREAAHSDLARGKMDLFMNSLKDIAQVEEMPKMQGNQLIMILTPNKT
jgi:translation initiation factor IF-3